MHSSNDFFVFLLFTWIFFIDDACARPWNFGNTEPDYYQSAALPSIYPEENNDVRNVFLTEGDIFMDVRRTAVRDQDSTWRTRVVPYVIDESYNKTVRQEIHMAFTECQRHTCVRFKPRDNEADYIRIRRISGCYSRVGRNGGAQDVSIGTGCESKGTILHELMHALGFWHEHSRPDRDTYIEIKWDNIAVVNRHNFNKFSRAEIDNLGSPYDYGSIMHYAANTFAINRAQATIVPKFPTTSVLGQRLSLSATDIFKINTLYKCNITRCPDPGVPEHGQRQGDSLSVGSTLTYRCLEGHTRVGSDGRYCQDNGHWTGYQPVCIPGNILYCNFDEASLCGWSQQENDQQNWTWWRSSTPTQDTGPSEDHTLQTSAGSYVYLEASQPVLVGDTARLISPWLQPFSSAICIRFYYHMHGNGQGQLVVYSRRNGSDANIFSANGDQENAWLPGDITITPSVNFQIVFEAKKGANFRSDIAIDDVIVAPCSILDQYRSALPSRGTGQSHNALSLGSSSDHLTCTFSHGLCGFTQDTDETFDWWHQGGPTITVNTGPDCDQSNCTHGKYLYIESSSPRQSGDVARVTSPVLQTSGTSCVSFSYSMFGDQMGVLSVYWRGDARNTQIWSRTGNQGRAWYNANVQFTATPNYQIVFEAVRGAGFKSDIAIDDVDIAHGHCVGPSGVDCDFEHGWCGWSQGGQDDFNWSRNRGSTGTPGTGPSIDHTTVTGYYAYIETSAPRERGHVAKLVSPSLQPNTLGYCLTFWYHMYGADVSELRVQVRSANLPDTQLWQLTGNQGDAWKETRVHIPHLPNISQAVLDGTVGASYRSDIAVDDITLTPGPC